MVSGMQNLVIDPERLWGELMETAAIGGTPKGGICRLTLTDLDRQVRDWFAARAEALGLTVTVDDMGAMFARREGAHSDVPPIALGSHLDTQPTGGKFDGARRQFVLASVHPGHTVAEVIENTGFDFDRPRDVPTTPAPSPELLHAMRSVAAPELAEVYPQFAAAVFGIQEGAASVQ